MSRTISGLRASNIAANEDFVYLSCFQNELRELLSWYLNGMELTCFSKIAYPVIDSHSIRVGGKLKNILNSLNRLAAIYDLSNCKHAILDIQKLSVQKSIPSKRLAKIIVQLEKMFAQILAQRGVPGNVHKIDSIQDYSFWQTKQKDDKYLYPIHSLREYLSRGIKASLKGLYLHGSLSTLDYKKGFSDFDLMAIIKKKALFCEQSLINIRRHFINAYNFLYLIDIFQHHGIGIISELDMSFYPQSYFPLKLFEYATELIKTDSVLRFSTRDPSFDNKLIFKGCCQYFKHLATNGISIKRAYDFKSFISNLLLLPCIYYQLKENDYCYKKYSFEMVRSDFSDDVWHIVEKAERVRNNWCYADSFPKYFQQLLGELPGFKMLPRIKRRISRVASDQLNTMGSNMLRESLKLAEEMNKNLIKIGVR